MTKIITPKLSVFKGLNNALSPCSYKYIEGTAYVSDNSRINQAGLWAEQPALSACTTPPEQQESPFGNGNHVKNCAVEGVNQIITKIDSNESVAVGPNRYLYSAGNSGSNEVQTIHYVSGTGNFTLTYDGQTTGNIAHDATAATIVTALKALSNIGASDVSGSGGPFNTDDVVITFIGDLAATDVPLMVFTSTAVVGTVTETTKGARGRVKYQDKNGSNGSCTAQTPPSTCSAATGDGTSARGENGIYYYMCTYFDNDRKRESLPSAADSAEIDHADGAKDRIVVTTSWATSAKRIRIYRTKRTSATDGIYNATNIFYFVTELSSGRTYTDYLHDTEIESREYDGRGSPPPKGIDCLIPYNNRMLYFCRDGFLYWSSADQPEDIALEYTVEIDSEDVTCKPLLSLNTYGESKFEIAELAGQRVTAAMQKGGVVWVWTAGMTGYIQATNNLEGYRFHVVRRGIGAVSDKVLADTPCGIFGADRQGVWLLSNTGKINRLSDGQIDIKAGTGKSTALAQSDITDSFGVWLPTLKEYWWCVGGDTQIVYQANRGVFVGPYSLAIVGGCNFESTGGMQAFLNDGSIPLVGVDAEEPSSPTKAQEIGFWMGQSSLSMVKDKLQVEILYDSITATKTVTVMVYQNNVASTTGATDSGNHSHTDDNLVGLVEPNNSGRMHYVKITIPSDCAAPIAKIGYRANVVPWNEKSLR